MRKKSAEIYLGFYNCEYFKFPLKLDTVDAD